VNYIIREYKHTFNELATLYLNLQSKGQLDIPRTAAGDQKQFVVLPADTIAFLNIKSLVVSALTTGINTGNFEFCPHSVLHVVG